MTNEPLRPAFYAIDTDQLVSGVNTWIKNLSVELKKQGHEPILIINTGMGSGGELVSFCNSYAITHLQVNRLELLVQEKTLPRIIAFLVENKCQYWLPGYFDIGYYITSSLYRIGIKTITVLHSDDARYKTYFENFVIQKGPNQSHALVSVSEYLDSWSVNQPHELPRRVIGYGVNVPESKINRKSSLKLVYCGRLEQEQKRIKDVLSAFQMAVGRYKKVEATIIGDGSLRDYVVNQIQKTANPRLIYAGSFPNSKIQQKLSEQDVLVLLSEYEGLPLIMLEAMAVGLPVISLNLRSGTNQLLSHEKTGLIVQDRNESFLAAIEFCLNHPEKIRLMGNNARTLIKEKFSTERNAAHWIDFLQSLLDRERKAPQQSVDLSIPTKFKRTKFQICLASFFLQNWNGSQQNLERILFLILNPSKVPNLLFKKLNKRSISL